MAKRQYYQLTPTARRQLRQAKAWSMARWGAELTREYFVQLDAAAIDLAKNHKSFRVPQELAGGTGLLLYPVREHYLVYEPVGRNKTIIVAVIRQGRDIATILSRGRHMIAR